MKMVVIVKRKFVRHVHGVNYDGEEQKTVPSCVNSLRESLTMFTQNGLNAQVLQGNLAYDGDSTDSPDTLDLQGDLTDIDKIRNEVKGKMSDVLQGASKAARDSQIAKQETKKTE